MMIKICAGVLFSFEVAGTGFHGDAQWWSDCALTGCVWGRLPFNSNILIFWISCLHELMSEIITCGWKKWKLFENNYADEWWVVEIHLPLGPTHSSGLHFIDANNNNNICLHRDRPAGAFVPCLWWRWLFWLRDMCFYVQTCAGVAVPDGKRASCWGKHPDACGCAAVPARLCLPATTKHFDMNFLLFSDILIKTGAFFLNSWNACDVRRIDERSAWWLSEAVVNEEPVWRPAAWLGAGGGYRYCVGK